MTYNDEIIRLINMYENNILDLRRELHKIPELGFKEYKTSRLIKKELEKLGNVEIYDNLFRSTGIMGVLRGKCSGPTILLRADIDALPINEENNLDYKSENKGIMHACGHDIHISWLIGTAMVLSKMQDHIRGTVKFVFQPAEELGGARFMERDLIMKNPDVDAVFAAHVWPSIEEGKVVIAEKYAFGAVCGFKITINTEGGHSSWPHETVDPIAVSNTIYTNMQQIISRKVDTSIPSVLSVGAIHAGPTDKGNIIPNKCEMLGTIRSIRIDTIKLIQREIKNIVKHISLANGAKYNVEFSNIGSSVVNDKNLVEEVYISGKDILGENNIRIEQKPNLGGEDFSYYLVNKPGVYFFVGGSSKDRINLNSLHSSSVVFSEKAIIIGVKMFSKLALDFLSNT